MTLSVDQIKEVATSYLEANAASLGRYLLSATKAWITNRRRAEAKIAELHLEYEREFADLRAQMQGEPAAEPKP